MTAALTATGATADDPPGGSTDYAVTVVHVAPASATVTPEVVSDPIRAFVDEARKLCLAPPQAEAPATPIEIVLDGERFRMWPEGWIAAEGRTQSLPLFVMDLYALFGWSPIARLREAIQEVADRESRRKQSTPVGGSARMLVSMVQAIEATLARHAAEFLTTLEAEMLDVLRESLEQGQTDEQATRARYLDPTSGALKRGEDGALDPAPKGLVDDARVLVGLRKAMAEHADTFGPLTMINLFGELLLPRPLELKTYMTAPEPDEPEQAWGATIGGQLRQWFKEEIEDYRQGRDALLRASAHYLAKARVRHPILPLLWPRLAEGFSEQDAAREIAAICAEVGAACAKSLDDLEKGKFTLLLQTVKPPPRVVREPPYFAGPPGAVTEGPEWEEQEPFLVAQRVQLEDRPVPERQLAELLASRGSVFERAVGGLAASLNKVSVWDLDATRAATMQRLLESEEAGPLEQATLLHVDLELMRAGVEKALRDTAVSLGLGLALAPVSAPLAGGVFALFGVLDALHEAEIRETTGRLVSAELLASAAGARRLLTRNPSAMPLFLALVGIVGDVAAVGRMVSVARTLDAAQLLIAGAWIGAELTEAHAELARMALQQMADPERETGR